LLFYCGIIRKIRPFPENRADSFSAISKSRSKQRNIIADQRLIAVAMFLVIVLMVFPASFRTLLSKYTPFLVGI